MCQIHTVADGAGLCFVKTDHLGNSGANLNLFVDLPTHTYKCIFNWRKWKSGIAAGLDKVRLLLLIKNELLHALFCRASAWEGCRVTIWVKTIK